ncbi:MAG: DUF4124 domain-containing protein [Methylococcales bacterium]
MLACILCLFCSQAALAKKMYRWVDDHGNTYFSDLVPPDQIQYKRDSLSKSGRVLEVTEKAKTQEQRELEKKLADLRKAQEKLIAKQIVHDRLLLSTFDSKDDMVKAINAKNQTLDTQRMVLEGNSNRLRQQLQDQQKKAANFERNAQAVPQELLNDINSTQEQILQNTIAINTHIMKHIQIAREDNADVERYLYLTQSKNGQQQANKIPSIKEANELGLFYCENDRQCTKAWEIAGEFVNEHSTTLPDVYNDRLIMNRPPAKDTDLSLSLSKIPINDGDYQLFLDIRCRDSILGKALCASQKVKDIRTAFQPFMNKTLLSRAAQQ